MEPSSTEYAEFAGKFPDARKKTFPNESISQRTDAHDGDNCGRKCNWRFREAR